MDYVQLISAAGIGGIIGSLLTTVVQAWLANQQLLSSRSFQEKKEAYVGYLDACTRNEIEGTESSFILTGYWKNRIELVGSPEVIGHCVKIIETNPIKGEMHPERPAVMHNLKNAMRKDLGLK